jgi:hypothetical protein
VLHRWALHAPEDLAASPGTLKSVQERIRGLVGLGLCSVASHRDFAAASRQDRASEERPMKKLFLTACCMMLAGCTATGISAPANVDPMQSDASTYVPAIVVGTYPSSADERLTSTCDMRGQSVVCR